MNKTITWLHISDIHFNSKTEWRDASSRDSLLNYLNEIFESEQLLSPDIVFCTGDIAFGAIKESTLEVQYKQAEVFFDSLLEACGNGPKPLPKERLYIVPGNHDVNRNSINLDAQKTMSTWAKQAETYEDEINQRFNNRSKEFLDAIKRLDEYGDFVQRYLPHQQDSDGRYCYSSIVNIDGIKVGVSGFNSAWTCSGPEDDRNIWLPAKWQFNTAKTKTQSADIKIGLIHHPVDWLNSSDQNIAKKRIAADFDFWLHGHIHDSWVEPNNDYLKISAGAIGAQSSIEFGFNIVQIDLEKGEGVIHLHAYDPQFDGWAIKPIPKHAPMGKWKFPLLNNRINLIQAKDTKYDEFKSSDEFLYELKPRKFQKQCLVSYFDSHQNKTNDTTIEYVIAVFKEALGADNKLLIAREIKTNENFKEFVSESNQVEMAVMLLTPEYKSKLNDKNSLVYNQYEFIKSSYMSNRNYTFQIFPVLIDGTPESSIPEELSSLEYVDLRGLVVKRHDSGQWLLPRQDRLKYDKMLLSLSNNLIASAVISNKGYQQLANSLFNDYFITLKAKWESAASTARGYCEDQFVKTNTYRLVESNICNVVVGRKGSGKSTLTQILPKEHNERYWDVILIDADEFNLEVLFNLFSNKKFQSDAQMTVYQYRTFILTWEGMLALATIFKLSKSNETFQKSTKLKQYVNNIEGKLKSLEDDLLSADLFTYAFSTMHEFIDKCIKESGNDPEAFIASIKSHVTRERYLKFLLGHDVLHTLRQTMKKLPKPLLITLDGFDTAFNEFRKDSMDFPDEVIYMRAKFEVNWLRTLLALTDQARSKNDDYIYQKWQFCCALPLDRFLEAVRVDRDSYRFWNRWRLIQWTGIELAILLRKRLAGMVNVYTDKNLPPKERLTQILKHEQYKDIPIDININFNGKSYTMPVFMYVLRHTFWRPREILNYYAGFLILNENLKRWNQPFTAEAIRRCIKGRTTTIIESEFYGELESTVLNIRNIVKSFTRAPIKLKYEQIQTYLKHQEFHFAVGEHTNSSQNDYKIKLLYEIGFLGLHLNENQRIRFGTIHEYCFQFNEGAHFIRRLDSLELDQLSWVIHPVFAEELLLDTRGLDLIMVMDWNYLYEAEAALASRSD